MRKITKAVAALMLMAAAVCVAGCGQPSDPAQEGEINGHTFVDLGLPSGTLWATCNVGAEAPEEYGYHVAWAETEPKDYYDNSTYKYSTGDYDDLTKYCTKSDYGYNGFTDGLIVLQPEDDAAATHWGSVWRTPTNEEWEELLSPKNTIKGWTTRNGVKGRLFKGRNGNSIFLPAAGDWEEGNLVNVGMGYYWSSTLSSYNPDNAQCMLFTSGSQRVGSYHRYLGMPVRPVCSPN